MTESQKELMPVPRLPIGTVLDPNAVAAFNIDYYKRTVVRQVIRRSQRIVYKLKRQGFMKGMVGKKMLPYNKEQIRATLEGMRNATSFEVAGYAPRHGHCIGRSAHESALNGIPSAMGGVEFNAYILFRFEKDGKPFVYIHEEAFVSESDLKELIIKPRPF